MATRSTIALEFADGTVEQVYCHYDGYLSHNGKILLQHWFDPFKLQQLIDLGNLSSLGKEIGVKHPFDNPGQYGSTEYIAFKAKYGDMCLFYGRDRSDVEFVNKMKFKDFADYKANHEEQEYEYILRTDGKWYVKSYNFDYVELNADLIAKDE